MPGAAAADVSWVKALLWLVPRRLRSHWVLPAITAFGILAAVTLMAMAPIYSRALAEGGLRHTIASVPSTALNSQVTVRNRPLGPQDYGNLEAAVREIYQGRIGYIIRDIQRWGKARPYDASNQLTNQGVQVNPGNPSVQLFFLTEFQEHSRLSAGSWPHREPVIDARGVSLDMVMNGDLARGMGIRLEDEIYLAPFPTDPSEVITLRVSGFAEPIDSRDEFWMGASSSYFDVDQRGEEIIIPIYVAEEHFFRGLGTRYPSLVGDYGWFLFLETDLVTGANVDETQEALDGLETDVSKRYPQSLVFTGLANALEDYERDLTMARAPLFLFLFLVVAVMLYFLALVMGLLTRSRSDEAGLLRSRGASMPQVTGLLVLGEGVIVLLSAAIGPFIALAIVKYLLADTIQPLGGVESLPVGLASDAFVMGAVGGVLSLAVLLASGLALSRMGMVESLSSRARPPSAPLLQRYYVDLALVALVGLLWWQMDTRGGFIDRDVLGRSLTLDPSILVGPVLALLAAALLMFRVLPLLMRLIGWTAGRISSAGVAFGLVRAARDPLPHSSLAVILMMGTALGVFGAAFQPSLSQSEEHQALYDLGADVVIDGASLTPEQTSRIAAIDGVVAVGPFREQPVGLVGRPPVGGGHLFAVDPESIGQTAWFRDDFSDTGITDLIQPLRSVPGGAQRIPLPEAAQAIGVWVNAAGLAAEAFPRSLNLWVRVSDDRGEYFNVLLGPLSAPVRGASPTPRGWTFMEETLRSSIPARGRPPFSVVSLFVSGASMSNIPAGSIGLDDLTAMGPFEGDEAIVVDTFDTPGTWEALPNGRLGPHTASITPAASRTDGGVGLRFAWRDALPQINMGVFIPPGPFPLPAIGDRSFRQGEEVMVQSARQMAPLRVSGTIEMFPTVTRTLRPFLLVSLNDYREYLARVGGGIFFEPETYWLALDPAADRETVMAQVREQLPLFSWVGDSAVIGRIARQNPLAGGGWNGLTILGIAAITVAVTLALGAYAVISVRSGRVDLAVARALGFSSGQFRLSLALEKITVAFLGIGVGAALGVWLSRWVLGFLDVTATGHDVIPPMIVTSHQGIIGLVVAALAAAVGGAILLSVASARRLDPPEILRTGM